MITREIDFRYQIVRGDADYCEIYPIAGGEPRIRMKDSAEIKTSFSGSFLPDERVNWLTDRIRPELILDGVTYPLGLFLPATVQERTDESQRSVQVEAYDLCWLAKDYARAVQASIAKNENYVAVIKNLLHLAGIDQTLATANAATLPEARHWEIGTPWLSIVNELLAEINYKPLWFNAQGLAVLEPKQAPTAANIRHEISSEDVRSLLLPAVARETDIYSAPNVFICVCANPDKSGNMAATATNSNVNSPLSVPRRGRSIAKVVKLNNIASQAELQAYADNLVRESMYAGETIEITTGLFPGYGVADIVGLNLDGELSICIEHAWEMQLRVGGSMKHTLEKVVVNYE